jgi:predicted nucleotidyltransferase component of viral defense system
MPHFETLTPESRALFPKLNEFKSDFYLAGGTALALQIGHRISVDFDLFSPEPIKKTLLEKVEAYADSPVETLVNNSRELTVLVHRVKHTFLHYPFPTLLPFEMGDPLELLSAKEILVSKAYTIGRRGALKDYIDLFVGIGEGTISLPEVVRLAREKYKEVFNDRLFLEQLLYLDDVAPDAVSMLGRNTPTKKELIAFFSEAIRAIPLS